MLSENGPLAVLSQSIPKATKPLYRLHQRLNTPDGIGRVIGVQECPGPEHPLLYYRLSDALDNESEKEPTWWMEDQVWPAIDIYFVTLTFSQAKHPHYFYFGTIEELVEGLQEIIPEIQERGESWKITLQRSDTNKDSALNL